MRNQKLDEINGIRGWAALAVMVFHCFDCVNATTMRWLDWPDYFWMWDGHLMVLVFFALSGDALSVSYTREVNASMSASVPIKRTLRLSGVPVISLFLTLLTMRWGLTWNKQASKILNNPWLSSLVPNDFSNMSFTNDVFFTGFVKMFRQTPALNPDLWTMADEFTGSIIIFAIGSVYTRLRYRYIILVLAMCFAYYHYRNMSLFIFGVVLGKLRADGIFSVCHRVLPLRILAGLAVLSLPYVNRVFVLPYLKTGIQFPFTCYLIFCLYASKDAVWFFSNKLSCFLGEISFPMYCLTVVTVCTFQSALIVKFSEAGVEVKSLKFAALSAFATVVVTACLAFLVRYVETKYLVIVDKIFGLFIRPNSTYILPLSHADPKDFLASPPYHVVPQYEDSRFPVKQNPKVDFSDNNHIDLRLVELGYHRFTL